MKNKSSSELGFHFFWYQKQGNFETIFRGISAEFGSIFHEIQAGFKKVAKEDKNGDKRWEGGQGSQQTKKVTSRDTTRDNTWWGGHIIRQKGRMDKKRDKKPKEQGNKQRQDVRNGFALESIENPIQKISSPLAFQAGFELTVRD